MNELSEEQHDDLLALGSYLNWLQNGFSPIVYGHFDITSKTREDHGHFDITSKTREDLDNFIGAVFDPANPIAYDDKEAAESQKRLSHLPAALLPSSSTTTQWLVHPMAEPVLLMIHG